MQRDSITGLDMLLSLMFAFPVGLFFFILDKVPSIVGFDSAFTFLIAGCIFPAVVAFKSGMGHSERTAVDRVRGWISFITGNFTALALSTILVPGVASIRSSFGVSAGTPIVLAGLVVAAMFARGVTRDLTNGLDNKTSMSLISSAPTGFLAAIATIMAVTIATNLILVWNPVIILAYAVFSWGALMPFSLLVFIERVGGVIRTVPGDVALYLTKQRRITKVNPILLSAFFASLLTTSIRIRVTVLWFLSLPLMLLAIVHPVGWWFSAGLAVSADACVVASVVLYLHVTRRQFVERLVDHARSEAAAATTIGE